MPVLDCCTVVISTTNYYEIRISHKINFGKNVWQGLIVETLRKILTWKYNSFVQLIKRLQHQNKMFGNDHSQSVKYYKL